MRTSKVHRRHTSTCNGGEKKLLGEMSLYLGHEDDTNEADHPADQARQNHQERVQCEMSSRYSQGGNTDVVHPTDGKRP